MKSAKIKTSSNIAFLTPIVLLYGIFTVISVNYGYFWDTIQQISKEAHWFYETNFSSLLMPTQDSGMEIVATGYHPPLMGIATAFLWKIFGYKLWVSHVFVFFWFVILFLNLYQILIRFFDKKNVVWVMSIVLLESALLTQFIIASPDFILFTAFIISLRSILDRKNGLLVLGIFVLCSINMRGIFAGVILFVAHIYYATLLADKKITFKSVYKIALPYFPTFLILVVYFTYYFLSRGWFFTNSPSTGHYAMPVSFSRIAVHLAEFILRSVENGRIIIWILAAIILILAIKRKTKFPVELKFLSLLFLLLSGLYLVFVFVSQMPFSARYFMPQFSVLTILTAYGLANFLETKRLKLIFSLILLFELTGNFWIYPDKIAKSWDCTLAHIPYYELRKDCFDYIDKEKLDYDDISADFCLYGNRKFVELSNIGKIVGNDASRKYFIFSNISNVEDSFANELQETDKWLPLKRFEKGYVYIVIYERTNTANNPNL